MKSARIIPESPSNPAHSLLRGVKKSPTPWPPFPPMPALSSSAAASSAVPSPITSPSSGRRRPAAGAQEAHQRHDLACGGAGAATLYSENLTQLAQYTVELYTRLEAETGQATGFMQPGSISIATNAERWEELLRGVAMLHCLRRRGRGDQRPRSAGEVAADERRRRRRRASGTRRTASAIRSTPAMALASAAPDGRRQDLRGLQGRASAGRERPRRRRGDRSRARSRPRRSSTARGMWARELGASSASTCRCMPASISTSSPSPWRACTPNLPGHARHGCLRLLQGGCRQAAARRLRAQGQALGHGRHPRGFRLRRTAGGFRPSSSRSWKAPSTACPGWRRSASASSSTGRRASPPTSATSWGRRRSWRISSSPPASTPSASSRAAARAWRWRIGSSRASRPSISGTSISAGSMPHQNRKSFLVPRVSEALGLLYAMHWPYRQFESSRGVRLTPLYDGWRRTAPASARSAGWERPNWFAPGARAEIRIQLRTAELVRPFARRGLAEHEACRPVRPSTFAKFLVTGPDASRCSPDLRQRCRRAAGRRLYPVAQRQGGIEADLTVTRRCRGPLHGGDRRRHARRDRRHSKQHTRSGRTRGGGGRDRRVSPRSA